jgi:hypothetical protein
MLAQWEKIISRGGNWSMKPNHTVCELHFKEEFIEKSHQIIIDGNDLSQNREKKKLKPNAIPTELEAYPAYMRPKLNIRKPPTQRNLDQQSRKRNIPTTDQEIKIKIKKLNLSAMINEIQVQETFEQNQCEEEILMSRPLTLLEAISENPNIVKRPNTNWHVHRDPNFCSFVHISTNQEVIQIDRYIRFSNGTHQVFLNGLQIKKELQLNTLEEVASFLETLNGLQSCPGTGTNGVWAEKCLRILSPSGKKGKIPPRCQHCSEKRKSLAKRSRRSMSLSIKKAQKLKQYSVKVKYLKAKVKVRNEKVRLYY